MRNKLGTIAVCIMLLAALLIFGSMFRNPFPMENPDTDPQWEINTGRSKPELQNYLVFTTDSDVVSDIFVISLDNHEKTVNILRLAPNTLCQVPILNENDIVTEYTEDALSSAFSQAGSVKVRCVNLKKAVEKLLLGTEIMGYGAVPEGMITDSFSDSLASLSGRLSQITNVTTDMGFTTLLSLAEKAQAYTFQGVSSLPGAEEDYFILSQPEADSMIQEMYFASEK